MPLIGPWCLIKGIKRIKGIKQMRPVKLFYASVAPNSRFGSPEMHYSADEPDQCHHQYKESYVHTAITGMNIISRPLYFQRDCNEVVVIAASVVAYQQHVILCKWFQ